MPLNFHRLVVGPVSVFVVALVLLQPRASRAPASSQALEMPSGATPFSKPTFYPHARNTESKPVIMARDSVKSFGQLPVYFEPNLGQTDSQVKFIVRGSGAPTFLKATGAVFTLPIADWRLPIEDMTRSDGRMK